MSHKLTWFQSQIFFCLPLHPPPPGKLLRKVVGIIGGWYLVFKLTRPNYVNNHCPPMLTLALPPPEVFQKSNFRTKGRLQKCFAGKPSTSFIPGLLGRLIWLCFHNITPPAPRNVFSKGCKQHRRLRFSMQANYTKHNQCYCGPIFC